MPAYNASNTLPQVGSVNYGDHFTHSRSKGRLTKFYYTFLRKCHLVRLMIHFRRKCQPEGNMIHYCKKCQLVGLRIHYRRKCQLEGLRIHNRKKCQLVGLRIHYRRKCQLVGLMRTAKWSDDSDKGWNADCPLPRTSLSSTERWTRTRPEEVLRFDQTGSLTQFPNRFQPQKAMKRNACLRWPDWIKDVLLRIMYLILPGYQEVSTSGIGTWDTLPQEVSTSGT